MLMNNVRFLMLIKNILSFMLLIMNNTRLLRPLGMVPVLPPAPPHHHRPPTPPPLRPVLPVGVVLVATDQTGGPPPATPVLPRHPLRLPSVAGLPSVTIPTSLIVITKKNIYNLLLH
ncbi:hypothetical protein HanIR_Chr02g0067571 [Helianthus annuus]|nr:hypothetical protein HanIR_Chr02g0067571 [Helianthus annuus]